jgi:hypothetical protein
MKTDKVLDRLTKRLDNLLNGSSPSASNKWDNGPSSSSSNGGGALATTIPNKNNWDMINQTIKEHPGNNWYFPREDKCNGWTCDVMLTLGNIDLRDFALERKFRDMR